MLKALNTADHFTLMMDHEIRKSGLSGNFCALVFELDRKPDERNLEKKVQDFLQRFPEVNTRLIQKGRKFFWQSLPYQSNLFFTHYASSRERALEIIQSIINPNTPANEAAPITFHVINMPEGSFFLLRWFHPICDAKGAELVAYYLLSNDAKNIAAPSNPFEQLNAKWSLWKKAKMMYQAKKHIDRLDQISSSLPPRVSDHVEQLNFKVIRFDQDVSRHIMKRAMKEAGMMGTALYFIGCLMRAMEQSGCDEKQGFCVPYAMNMRKRKALSPVFGNQVSFLFAQADIDKVRDRAKLYQHLKDQYKATIQQKLDQALVPLMWAGSWLPLEKYGNIIRHTPKGEERSSFWFSYTGEPEPKVTDIAGAKVKSMFQLSQVTSPPALGLLVSQYNGEITLSLNYVASQMDSVWLEKLIHHLKTELQGDAA